MIEIFRKYYQDLLVAVLAFIFISFTGVGAALNSLLRIIIEVGISIAVSIVIRLLGLWPQLHLLMRHYGEMQGVQRKASFALFTPRLERELFKLQELSSVSGVLVEKNELDVFVQACFSSCNGAYQGVDSHKPTTFFELYPQYLLSQQQRKRTLNISRILFNEEAPLSADIRFLLVEQSDLESDYRLSPNDFNKFYQLHALRNITLLQVSPSSAYTLAQDLNLPSSDVGIFGWRYAVFFKPNRDSLGIIRYRIFLRMLGTTNSALLLRYILFLNESSYRIKCTPADGLVFLRRSREDIDLCRSSLEGNYSNRS